MSKPVGSAKGEARVKKARAASQVEERALTLEEKKDKIKAIAAVVNKSSGREMMFVAGEKTDFGVTERVSSGVISIDRLTGGGLPRGKVTEVVGGEGVGKTTLALTFVSKVQAGGGLAVYIDSEWELDRAWAVTNGVDMENLVVVTPTTAEEGLQTIIDICKEGAADIIVLDSVVALATLHEKGRKLTDESIGKMAAKLSQFFRMSKSEIARANAAVVMINQIRSNPGSYGNPEQAPGGHALKHYKALSIRMRRSSTGDPDSSTFYVKEGGKNRLIGFPMAFKVQKNKIGDSVSRPRSTPGSEASVDFYFGSGFDIKSDVLNQALEAGVPCIKRAGTWFTFTSPEGQEKKAQGKMNFIDSLGDADLIYLRDQIAGVSKEKTE
jgi:recombination protein RecA